MNHFPPFYHDFFQRDGPLFFYRREFPFGKPAHNFFSHSAAPNNFSLSFYSREQFFNKNLWNFAQKNSFRDLIKDYPLVF